MKTAGMLISAAFLLSACATSPQTADARLASQIKKEIAQTEGIGGARSVNVETHKGVVVLSGFIENEQQRYDAGQAALKVSGVQQVFNNIQVTNQASGQ